MLKNAGVLRGKKVGVQGGGKSTPNQGTMHRARYRICKRPELQKANVKLTKVEDETRLCHRCVAIGSVRVCASTKVRTCALQHHTNHHWN